jgi:GNAT superfamily N-acetyltransferase
MALEFAQATTPDEIAAVQRLRYAVYVEEMDRYHDVAGADDGRFAEPEDAYSWIFYARDGADVVAATRMTWGGAGFSERQIDQYQLAPFLAELPAEMMAVGERNTVLPAYRGTGVLEELVRPFEPLSSRHDIRVVFGCCEPHLLSLYLKMGQQTYASHNFNSPSAGYLIPLVSFVPDVDALRGVGQATAPGRLPACIEAVLARGGSVRSEVLSAPEDYWSEIRRTLDELDAQRVSVFDGFTDDEAKRCIARSTIIECTAGDRVLKRGGTARNVFVVLDGTLNVRDGDTIVNVLTAGDVFGEFAFLLERPRSFDVDAVADGTRILSLSEGALRRMITEDATIAAKLLLNLSKMLCVKLIRAH